MAYKKHTMITAIDKSRQKSTCSLPKKKKKEIIKRRKKMNFGQNWFARIRIIDTHTHHICVCEYACVDASVCVCV